jgi:biotin-dependent carboxylase-like uncharacterized protein
MVQNTEMQAAMPLFTVMAPGPFTTVQDLGRYGYQQYGVPISGVMDSFAARLANMLVGNDEGAAVLECTLAGPALMVLSRADVAVTGAEMEVTLNGRAMANWSSFAVEAGDMLTIGQARSGCRGYLAVTGGIEVAPVMGSRSCCVSAGIGGLHGRALAREDRLDRGGGRPLTAPRALPQELIPVYRDNIVLRAIAGPQDDFFDEGLATFFTAEFQVSHETNRMGCRLTGPVISPKPDKPPGIISEASVPGGVQIPPNGQPIILLAEQTVGGYAKIATVVSGDLDQIGQAIPGATVRFRRIELADAHRLLQGRQRLLERLGQLLALPGEIRELQRSCAAD